MGLVLAASVVLLASVAAASDGTDRVRAVAPGGVTLTEVEEMPGSLRIAGEAESNVDVAAFLRALVRADLGRPEVQQVVRAGERSRFVLRIDVDRQEPRPGSDLTAPGVGDTVSAQPGEAA